MLDIFRFLANAGVAAIVLICIALIFVPKTRTNKKLLGTGVILGIISFSANVMVKEYISAVVSMGMSTAWILTFYSTTES